MSAEHLLLQLKHVVQKAPNRWIARCPAYDDRTPSLSISDEDGRILLYDFGGCPVSDVLAALGLSLSDLYDRPLSHNADSVRRYLPPRELLEIVSHEVHVALLILNDIGNDEQVDKPQLKRLALCASRIGRARDYGR